MLQVNSGNLMRSIKTEYSFWDLLKIIFKILFYKMNFTWELDDGKGEREKERKKQEKYVFITLYYNTYFSTHDMIRFILHVVFTWVLTGSIATLETSLSASLWQCTQIQREWESICVWEKERAREQSLSLWKLNLLQPAKICLGDLLRQKVRHYLFHSHTKETLTYSCVETVVPFSSDYYFSVQLTCGADGKVFGKARPSFGSIIGVLY